MGKKKEKVQEKPEVKKSDEKYVEVEILRTFVDHKFYFYRGNKVKVPENIYKKYKDIFKIIQK